MGNNHKNFRLPCKCIQHKEWNQMAQCDASILPHWYEVRCEICSHLRPEFPPPMARALVLFHPWKSLHRQLSLEGKLCSMIELWDIQLPRVSSLELDTFHVCIPHLAYPPVNYYYLQFKYMTPKSCNSEARCIFTYVASTGGANHETVWRHVWMPWRSSWVKAISFHLAAPSTVSVGFLSTQARTAAFTSEENRVDAINSRTNHCFAFSLTLVARANLACIVGRGPLRIFLSQFPFVEALVVWNRHGNIILRLQCVVGVHNVVCYGGG